MLLNQDWIEGEIVAKRSGEDGKQEFYIHYIDYNKRLDEWVCDDQLDVNKVLQCTIFHIISLTNYMQPAKLHAAS